MNKSWLVILVTVALLTGCGAAEKNPGAVPGTPLAEHTLLDTLSQKRGRIVLNGLWGFEPALDSEQRAPAGKWGSILVPGSWTRRGESSWHLPGVQEADPAWKDAFKDASRAWYVRQFEVPPEWAGRAILVDFARLSTDASVYVNGQHAGYVSFPFGEVEITHHAKVGINSLLVEVVAENSAELVAHLMGAAANQQTLKKAELEDKGLISDVTLYSRPKGAHVSDVFVMTSTRKSEVTLDVEFSGVKRAGVVELEARMMNGAEEEESFSTEVRLTATPVQRAKVSFDWSDPRLWDIGQPEMYTLQLRAQGAGIDDEYPQEFGFREFWIDGKTFMLNGSVFKPRPILASGPYNVEAIDAAIDGYVRVGFNTLQQWPNDDWVRGTARLRELWYERADRKGIAMYGVAKHPGSSITDPNRRNEFVWDEPAVRASYERDMQAELRRVRNHPSVVMWGSAGNYFGSGQDQNPRMLGKRWAGVDKEDQRHRAGEEAFALIRTFDPTRPVYSHSGSVGACHTTNHYLNFIPLQEREEWLTHYAEHGEVPFFPVEFGTPLYFSYSRGRNGFGALNAEPWLTEFAAIYLGPEAYRIETARYRQLIAELHQGGDTYKPWPSELSYEQPASRKLQELFVRNTWRSWRATGSTAGMIPWDFVGMLWKEQPDAGPLAYERIEFEPGQPGAFYSKLSLKTLGFLDSEHGYEAGESGQALIENNQPTLAWIAGHADALTAKDSRFFEGQSVNKQAVLHNDTREPQPFELSWRALIGDRVVAQGAEHGELDIAEKGLFPIQFRAPEIRVEKEEGKITLQARIGKSKHEDEFAFRVFKKRPPADLDVALIDPVGGSKEMLNNLGVRTGPWNGEAIDNLIVVAREALSHDGGRGVPLTQLQRSVKEGARLLILGQDPQWLRQAWGFRVNRYPARRVYGVVPEHPVLAGLDDRDLVDWAGTSTLVDAKPHYSGSTPPYGWHWGNRGAVSSAPLEKPHRSGWTPLLQTEFDLQYSPLLELRYGKGRVVLAMLDFEDHITKEPAARRLAKQVLEYANSRPDQRTPQQVTYVGGAEGKKLLEATGVDFSQAYQARPGGTIVVGQGARLGAAALERLAKQGSRVLVLAGDEGEHYGVDVVKREFHGSSDIAAWPELVGISSSDLRMKVDLEVPLIQAGAEVTAGGLFARRKLDEGVILYAQLDPQALNTKGKPYLRLTAWRQLRSLSQVLANLGARFQSDDRVFQIAHGKQSLVGEWRMQFTQKLEPSPSALRRHHDPGPSADARALLRPDADVSQMQRLDLPAVIPQLKEFDGEVIVQREFTLPESWAASNAAVKLGVIDDHDITYVNGHRVGATEAGSGSGKSTRRIYRVPAGVLKPGKNTITIRVFDAHGEGGFTADNEEFGLFLVGGKGEQDFYSPDYKSDEELGDEPYRYYRW